MREKREKWRMEEKRTNGEKGKQEGERKGRRKRKQG